MIQVPVLITYLIYIPLPDGERPTLAIPNSDDFKTEYEALDDAELEELVANHTEYVSSKSGPLCKRNSAQARVQDVCSTIRTIQKLVRHTSIFFSLSTMADFPFF